MTHRPTPDDDEDHAPPRARWIVRRGRALAFALLGLALAASLASVYLTYRAAEDSAAQAAAVNRRLAVLEEDLNDRTRQRDAERDAAAALAAQDRELFRARFCEVLTELSATFPNLDQLRQALGCPPPDTPGGSPSGYTRPGAPPAGSSTAAPSTTSTPASAPAPRSAPASPSPAPPSQPPDGPGLICGLLPLLC